MEILFIRIQIFLFNINVLAIEWLYFISLYIFYLFSYPNWNDMSFITSSINIIFITFSINIILWNFIITLLTKDFEKLFA